MKYVIVTFENGGVIETRVNGTNEEIIRYYMLSGKINIGTVADNFQQAVSVEFVENVI